MIQPIPSDSRINITRILAILITTGIIVGLIYGLYSLFDSDGSIDNSLEQRVITVEVGDVIDSTSIQGTTIFPNNSLLRFGIDGLVSKIHVQEGDAVSAGQILMELDEYSIATANLSVAAAQYELYKSHQALQQSQKLVSNTAEALHSMPVPVPDTNWAIANQIVAAIINRNQLVDDLAAAQGELDFLVSPSEFDTASVEVEYLSLQLSLKAVQQDYDEMLSTVSFPNINELDHTRARLTVLRHHRDNALETWERMVAITKSQYTQEELLEMFTHNFAKVATIEQALAKINAQISLLTSLPSDELVGLQQAKLSHAVETLAKNQARVVEIVAPHDGIIRRIHVTLGSSIKAYQVVVDLVDPSVIHVASSINEVDALRITSETRASVTFHALPGYQFPGQIVNVSNTPVEDPSSVSYEVTVAIDDTLEANETTANRPRIMEGLSSTIDIVTLESKGVLRIPIHTVTGSMSLPTVILYDDESEIPDHPITIGNHDDYWIEVIKGLSEGDQILGVTLQSLSDSSVDNLINITTTGNR
jgi:multidrug efflux pump subunit AcrA (membrane-fusion protein)